jgi:beta-N-acetylhexosaminidase
MVYSDLSMIVLRRVLEAASGIPIDKYVDSVFYKPLGMNNTSFLPALRLPTAYCAPTEIDEQWRKKKVQGYVHDQAAAMLGGVSGNAGLFSNVYDIGKITYMLKNGGRYGDRNFLAPETVAYFTSKQEKDNRRALGWDRPGDNDNMASTYCSELTYGHTGFTGIGVWVDPQYDLVFIFLSNRTFPSANNRKLISNLIRPRMQTLLYESIFEYQNRRPV